MKPTEWLPWVGTRAASGNDGPLREIRLAEIRPNPFQPRRSFDEASLTELAESIRRVGLLQPLLVRPGREGGYELVAGERRWRAAQMAGLERVPAIVRPMDDQETAVLALVENLQREDLSFFDEAVAYQQLLERFGLTQEQLARLLGKQQSTIANKLRLLRLPEDVRQRIVEGGLSERHARSLLRLPSAEEQKAVVEEVIQGRLSVRETESLVSARVEQRRQERRRRPVGRQLRVIKDARILINTVRMGVETLRRAGLAASFEQAEDGDWIEVRIRIPRRRGPDAPSRLR